MAFKPVSSEIDFPKMERNLLDFWQKEGIVEKYLHKNDSSKEKFSFLDGPKTANNPMGVHHAWGRTYKDLWQRWYNMRGYKQRFQNGFDEQGLWVEVEVEKALGLKSKKDIENIVPGDRLASLEKFISLCKGRIQKYSAVITEQSKRLGQFMDWDNSYHTSSDQNNYLIWYFLKNVYNRGWLYKGADSVPWCPRCGTAISQHEMQAEDYKELTHESVYVEYPIEGRENEYLLVWTTTPWTLPGNVAIALDPDKEYVVAYGEVAGNKYYLSKTAAERLKLNIGRTIKGKGLVGLNYQSPFDDLPRIQNALKGYKHQVVETDPLILPISDQDGTAFVHIAPGAGSEDFKLGKKLELPVIELIDEEAKYLDGLGEFSSKNAKVEPKLILEYLQNKEDGKYLFDIVPYTHRYPTCWRCKTELVWRVVDEWYIAVDKEDPEDGQTFRQKMIKVAKEMKWQPKFVENRELDWLENLHDWLISKKRYWGLALPIWECRECGYFEVIEGYKELKEKAVEGWDKFVGHDPHRPWIDKVKIKCSKCNCLATRVPDVGNPWLDAGIVPYSTITEVAGEIPSYITDKKYWNEWFPPNFAVEMYEQTRLWFYALIAMSSALEEKPPIERIFGHGKVVDEKGEEMHGSKDNAIDFDEAVEKVGADVMRWLYLTANPANDLRFGYHLADEARKRFHLILWNVYKFFIDYALVYNWHCELERKDLTVLDKWVLARLTEVILTVNSSLEKYDAATASRNIEDFVVEDLSTWYVRRSRSRFGVEAEEAERNLALGTLYGILVSLCRLLAPFIPFISEAIYQNLETGDESVHLTDYPKGDKSLLDKKLIEDMKTVRIIAEKGHASRKDAAIKLRQPLAKVTYSLDRQLAKELEKVIADELNVKAVEYKKGSKEQPEIELDINITQELKEEGEARELIRQIQQLRKEASLTLADSIEVTAPSWPEKFEEMILKMTKAKKITKGDSPSIKKVS